MSDAYAKLHGVSLGLALGILSGAMMFLFGIFAMWEYGVAYVNLISSVYIGYGPTLVGAILGAVWGFVEGFVIGYVVSWLYNYMLDKCPKYGKK